MNLLQIRTKFRDLSGRYDLVNDDFSDNGADFFINEACKWLDKTVETTKSYASHLQMALAGTWYVKFPRTRAIKEVWVASSTSRWQLHKKRLQDLLAGYYTAPNAQLNNGVPLYYSPAVSRYIPEVLAPADVTAFSALTGIIDPTTNPEYDSIIFSCKVDQSLLIEVKGLFLSDELTEDESENYWSRNHALLLIQTSIRQTHLISGNKPMLDVLDRGIDGELQRLGMEVVEQEIAEVDEMEG